MSNYKNQPKICDHCLKTGNKCDGKYPCRDCTNRGLGAFCEYYIWQSETGKKTTPTYLKNLTQPSFVSYRNSGAAQGPVSLPSSASEARRNNMEENSNSENEMNKYMPGRLSGPVPNHLKSALAARIKKAENKKKNTRSRQTRKRLSQRKTTRKQNSRLYRKQ
jgi:hypothetical protein